jgi:hypothetical protein
MVTVSRKQLAERFAAEDALAADAPPGVVAPSQTAAVITMERKLEAQRWGLKPAWAPHSGHSSVLLINARAESLTHKPTFRDLLARQRCLIPANGFFEWEKLPTGKKRALYFRLPSGGPFAFAGLWMPQPDTPLRAFTIITTADLRKSILTLAVQGKLVPQDPADEPAEMKASAGNAKAVSANSSINVPYELPSSWRWVRLGQIGELINGDRSKNYPNKVEYVREGVPWINIGHIEPDGTLSLDSMHYITRKKFDSLRSGKVQKEDLVYCLRGATLGKTAIITQFEEGAVAPSLVIIRLAPNIDHKFMYRVLISPLGREQIFQFDNGSAQPNLSAASVKKYFVPLPPLAEQRRIVAKVDQLMKLVDALEVQLAASAATAGKLMEALVAELTKEN